ncbi:MAG: hypothetical protein ACREIV_06790, partial [Planctomycetaceae bacterium]
MGHHVRHAIERRPASIEQEAAPMFTKRVALAAAGGLVVTSMLAGPVSAAKPAKPPAPAPAPAPVERALTAEEVAAAEQKLAVSDAYLASVASAGSDLASLSCVTPTGTGPQAVAQACYVPAGYLSVTARDQVKNTYCGPATGQVIANYSWAVAAGANKYTQAKIAGWMRTDINGYTNAPELED